MSKPSDTGEFRVIMGRCHLDDAGSDDPETHPGILVEVRPVMDRFTDADVDRMVLHQQALFVGSAQTGAMPWWRVEMRWPTSRVRIEVDQRDRAVNRP
jgi:hypothetical protein